MKATGIVRRIDDLGRVVIPKEIRRTMRIREGDPLEIYTDADGEVIFKKYSPIGELSSFTGQYAEVLSRSTNLPVLICDRDHVIACAGIPKREAVDRRISANLESLMEKRSNFVYSGSGESLRPVEGLERMAGIAYPIIGSGDVSGAVVLLMAEKWRYGPILNRDQTHASCRLLPRQADGGITRLFQKIRARCKGDAKAARSFSFPPPIEPVGRRRGHLSKMRHVPIGCPRLPCGRINRHRRTHRRLLLSPITVYASPPALATVLLAHHPVCFVPFLKIGTKPAFFSLSFSKS